VTVFLVGAGPGDPGLITVRGLELVRRCDAVVYDTLVADELVAEAPAGALVVSREGMRQAEIDELLVSLGRRGLETVRLKGGDPFLFGRGGEEALALAAAGVPFEIVPGVSALSAVPAAAGIPITHRGVSAQVTVVSGHSADGRELDYADLGRAPGTLVVFMGLRRLPELCAGLVAHGRDAATPAAVVSAGTTSRQEVVVGTLANVADRAADLAQPALVVVGEVVSLGLLDRGQTTTLAGDLAAAVARVERARAA
jgi:uroporphyrin-III C-methyltransferase